MAASNAERQAAYRRRLKAQGLERISAYVDPATARTFRNLAAAHDQPQAAVFKLGTLAAARLLAGEKLVPADSAETDLVLRIDA
ncbi:hypothetical protein [Afifella aestuarii]|uniref:hypothetical protein n=1 Tax=Afifella aestuarii TaxID=1909496 RepID=UPI000FE41A29|nr:hypothetical protein [Afifella aestuarii]